MASSGPGSSDSSVLTAAAPYRSLSAFRPRTQDSRDSHRCDVPTAAHVPFLFVDGQRRQRAVPGAGELVGQVALVGQLLEQGGADPVGPLVMPQRQLELLGRLAVRAETRGPGGGERGVACHGGLVAAAGGVVGQPPVVMRTARRSARREPGRGPRSAEPGGRDRSTASRARSCRNPTASSSRTRTPRSTHSSTAASGCPDTAARSSALARPPSTEAAAATSRPACDSRDTRASTASRTVSRHLPGAVGGHLGDVERVPAGELKYRVGVQGRAGRVEELPHAGDAERGKLHPDHAG